MKRLLIVICMVVLLLNGCMKIQSQKTTEQEDKIIAEYMAKLILKYDKDYKEGLIDLEDIEPTTDEPEEITTNTAEPTTANDNPTQLNEIEEETEPQIKEMSIKKILNNENLTLSIDKYSILNNYSDINSGTGSGTYNFEAQADRKIILVEMTLKNTSNKKQKLDLIDSNVSFKLRFEGGNIYIPLLTFMSNDLAIYDEELNEGEEKAVMLLFDVRISDTTDIKSLYLDASNDKGKTVLQIK